MKGIKKSQTEIKNAIKDQLTYINNSCKLFDNGCHAEAIRISAAINVLIEKRSRSKGLLYHVRKKIKIASTAPNCDAIDVNRLIVKKYKKYSDAPHVHTNTNDTDIKKSKKIILTFFTSEKKWHIYAYKNNTKISCYIDDLAKTLDLKNQILMVGGWIKAYQTSKHEITPIGKSIILTQLNALLNHRFNYPTGLYFPLLGGTILKPTPNLKNEIIKNISIEDWKNEIVFAIDDDKRKLHTLTRWELIASARDQDGGGHYDRKIDKISYYLSKHGRTLLKSEDNLITTKNFHLLMLRQLGHEFLVSMDIKNYSK